MTRWPWATALLVFASAIAHAQWRQNGVEIPDEPWHRSDGQFGAMLVVIDNVDEFFEQWSRPTAPGYAPTIKPTHATARGGTVDAVITFSGCTAGDDGNCRCEVDFTVFRPDGSTYAAQTGVPVWRSVPPPDRNVQVSDGRLRMRVEADDPIGTYRIAALVRDLVAKRQVSLEWRIAVNPSKP